MASELLFHVDEIPDEFQLQDRFFTLSRASDSWMWWCFTTDSRIVNELQLKLNLFFSIFHYWTCGLLGPTASSPSHFPTLINTWNVSKIFNPIEMLMRLAGPMMVFKWLNQFQLVMDVGKSPIPAVSQLLAEKIITGKKRAAARLLITKSLFPVFHDPRVSIVTRFRIDC